MPTAQETYSEDPWPSGHLGTAIVTGLQRGELIKNSSDASV